MTPVLPEPEETTETPMNHVTTPSSTATTAGAKKRLTILGDAGPELDLDAELRAFEQAERARLGLEAPTKQWVEDMANLTFTKKEKSNITLLVGGLTLAQDYLVEGPGRRNNVEHLPVNTEAFQMGKEFATAASNPTYFTVGALVQVSEAPTRRASRRSRSSRTTCSSRSALWALPLACTSPEWRP